jgi:hypothetical protein
MRIFPKRGRELWIFHRLSCAVRFPQKWCLWVFVLHILLVVNVSKLVNMWLMKTSWISDGGTNLYIPLWFWCKWEWHSATSSQHDCPGAIHRHPNWGDASALANTAPNRSTAAEQSPWVESWWPASSHQVWTFLCHEAPDVWGGQRTSSCRCVD